VSRCLICRVVCMKVLSRFNRDALATMFDAVYLQIAALVDSQIRAVQSKALSVKVSLCALIPMFGLC